MSDTTNKSIRLTIRLTPDELAKLDEFRGGSRPAAVRELIRRSSPSDFGEEASHPEAVRILARMARDGKVQAAVALERALRSETTGGDADDELARILRGD